MRRILPCLLSLALLAGVLAGLAAPADASWTGSCLPDGSGPRCTFWKGKVTFVDDGDTIDVDIAGDGTAKPARIRLTGIQAMEQSRYSHYADRRRGQCHSLEATARLEQLIGEGHGVVRLAAQDPRSSTGGRLRRSVAVNIGGHWTDVGRILTAEGHTLWLPNSTEYAWNRTYSMLAQQAASEHLRLWDTAYCGQGPAQGVPLRMWLRWDAAGDDGENVNGEWARIQNLDPDRDVSLARWWFRDSALRRFTFPSSAVVPAGRSITLYMGRGRNTDRAFFWGQGAPVFENASGGARAMGDGGYLFDPQGDLRLWVMYPCRFACGGRW